MYINAPVEQVLPLCVCVLFEYVSMYVFYVLKKKSFLYMTGIKKHLSISNSTDAHTSRKDNSDHNDRSMDSNYNCSIAVGLKWLIIWTGQTKRQTSDYNWPCLVDERLYISLLVKLNKMPVPCNKAEDEELNTNLNVKASTWMSDWCVLNIRVHVWSIVLYEYLRHSMTSHSGCWWFKSFHLRVNWECSWWHKCRVSLRPVTRLVFVVVLIV